MELPAEPEGGEGPTEKPSERVPGDHTAAGNQGTALFRQEEEGVGFCEVSGSALNNRHIGLVFVPLSPLLSVASFFAHFDSLFLSAGKRFISERFGDNKIQFALECKFRKTFIDPITNMETYIDKIR